jgi:hypothetical protein
VQNRGRYHRKEQVPDVCSTCAMSASKWKHGACLVQVEYELIIWIASGPAGEVRQMEGSETLPHEPSKIGYLQGVRARPEACNSNSDSNSIFADPAGGVGGRG